MAKAKIPKILKSDKRIYILAAVCVILVTSVVFGRGPVSRENLVSDVSDCAGTLVNLCGTTSEGGVRDQDSCSNSYKNDPEKGGAYQCDWRSNKCKFISGVKGNSAGLKCTMPSEPSKEDPSEPSKEDPSSSSSDNDGSDSEDNTMLIVVILVGSVILLGVGYWVFTRD